MAEPVAPEELVLDRAATVASAFERVRSGGHGLAVVVDDDGRVVGTVTDGALRRAAMAAPALDVPLTGVLSRRAVVADVAVCRAGAGTVAELAVVGLPAVLVPYPHATEDHQTANARTLADAGGALLVPDDEATADAVGPQLEARLDVPGGLDDMRTALRTEARPRAAESLATWALELAGDRG